MKDEEVLKLNFEGWPLPNEYLLELGRMTTLWATLESLLNTCIGKLIGFDDLADPMALILLIHTSFPQRLDMLGSVCEHLAPKDPPLKACQDVLASLKDAQKLRNKFAHHVMGWDERTGFLYMATASARGKLKFSTDRITVAALKRASMAIHEAIRDLGRLVLKVDIPPIWE